MSAAKKSEAPSPDELRSARSKKGWAKKSLADAAGCLTVVEVAEKSGVHRETVKRWIAEGKLKAFKLGGHWRIRPEHVAEYLKAQGAA